MTIKDSFWSSRLHVLVHSTLPSMYRQMKQTGRWDFLRLKWTPEDKNIKPHHFWDSDVAKFTEAAILATQYLSGYELEVFEAWIDDAIDMVTHAQQPDGYINSYFTVVEPDQRWKNVKWGHEMYCAGHLLECAVTHFNITGNSQFMDVLCRYIDHIMTVFGPHDSQLHGYTGHPELELALVRLISVRPEAKYLHFLAYLVNERGKRKGEFFDNESRSHGAHLDMSQDPVDVPFYEGGKYGRYYWYFSAHDELKNQKEIMGHSVRAVYLLAGVQGLFNLTRDPILKRIVHTLWRSMVDTKMYIIGGIGSVGHWEGFGPPFELPWDGYNETCASISILYLGKNMLQDELSVEVALVMERALYNNCLGGVSLDGTSFFYDQPIVGRGVKRSSWFECSCCPPNLAKLLGSLDEYALTVFPCLIAINLYIGLEHTVPGVSIKVTTGYPVSGEISIHATSDRPIRLAVRGEKEYIFSEFKIWKEETWSHNFPVHVEILKPDPRVRANEGCLAVKHGPFIYGLEQSRSSMPVDSFSISPNTCFEESLDEVEGSQYVSLTSKGCTLVPYFILGNQSPGEYFRIWLNNEDSDYVMV